jgi:hypothetical protein
MRKFYTASTMLLISLFARGEGSRELNSSTSSTAYRVFLSYTTPVTGSNLGWYPITSLDSVESRCYFYAYANANDSICVASSALAVGVGIIRVYAPDGSLFATYSTAPGDTGLIRSGIGSKLRENQGPFGLHAGGTGGYIPRVIVASQTGIWRVEFVSPNPATNSSNYFNNPTLVPLASADFNQSTNTCIISAFDVSVVKDNRIIMGRVYTDYMSLSGGELSRTVGSGPARTRYYFTETYTLYLLTKQGYRYNVTLNGIAPYGYFIYADNVGLQLADGVTPAYESISYQPVRPTNRRILRPGDPDTYSESKHKIFFNAPDAAMPTTATLNNQSIWLNPALINGTGTVVLRYTITGSPNPLSGYFTFDYPNLGIRYKIIIDANGDFIYGNANDVTLAGTSIINQNDVNWNGLDANGVALPLTSCLNARIEFVAGEVHIPLADAENFRGGIEIARLNGNGTLPNYTVHWNDSVLNDNNNISPTYMKKTPAAGVSSLGGVHSWERLENLSPPNPPNVQGYTNNPTHTTYYGDTRYMDIWAYDTLQTGNFAAIICYVLPLKLTGFTGMVRPNGHLLQWQTEGQWQGASFTLQRQTPSGFVTVAQIPATNATRYQFTNEGADGQEQVYRLLLRQADGLANYSNLVRLGGTVKEAMIFPNPNNGSFTIQAKGIQQIIVTDLQGKRVLVQTVANRDAVTISSPSLRPGVYYVRIATQSGLLHKTVTVQ